MNRHSKKTARDNKFASTLHLKIPFRVKFIRPNSFVEHIHKGCLFDRIIAIRGVFVKLIPHQGIA
jgi:hypothetical protein